MVILKPLLQKLVEIAVEGANAASTCICTMRDHFGIFTNEKIGPIIYERGWITREVSISHAIWTWGYISAAQQKAMADILADAGITIITMSHLGRKFSSGSNLLHRKGVRLLSEDVDKYIRCLVPIWKCRYFRTSKPSS